MEREEKRRRGTKLTHEKMKSSELFVFLQSCLLLKRL